jgi:hypothetical protein
MNIHDIIPIIIFILYVAAIIHKRRKKKKQAAQGPKPAKKPSRLFAKLGEKWAQALKELEKQAELDKRKKAGQATGWERLVGKTPPKPHEDESVLEWEDTPSGPLTPPPLKGFHYDPKKDQPKTVPKTVKPITARRRRHPLLGASQDVTDLRRAVVWLEILAPPLALRDPNDSMRQ